MSLAVALASLLAPGIAAALQEVAAPAAPAAEPRRLNLLVVTLDTARRDFFGFLGRTPSPTPNLDRLAAESIVFDDAYTVAPITLPAHTSLFTGLYPRAHGVHENSTFKVPQSALTLAEVLQSNGYATAATVAAFVLDPMFGLDQGFASYDAADVAGSGSVLLTQRPAEAVVDHALADLAKLAQRRPFFCWVHLYDPHYPYQPPASAPPPSFLVDPERVERTLYEGEIRYADTQLGRLLDALREQGRLEDTVILFASDHGESLRDSPEPTHGYFLHDSTVRIPMVLRVPGLAPRRVATQVSLVDAMPTLLDLLGIADPGVRFDGVDLAPLLRDPSQEAPDRALLLEAWYPWLAFGWAPFDGCVQGALKHLRSHRLELFDRVADPAEKQNLFDPAEPRSRLLVRRLDELMTGPTTRLERDAISLTGRDLARLLQMGYASATARLDDPPDPATLPDVYEKVGVIRALEQVVDAEARGDVDGEAKLLRELVAAEPQSASLHERLGILLVNRGLDGLDEAEEQLRVALRIEPKSSRSHNALGRIAEARAKRLGEEIKRRRDAGEERDALRDAIAEERHQTRRAMRSYRTTLEFEPNFPDAIERLARMLGEEADRDARAGDDDAATQGVRRGDRTARPLARVHAGDPSAAAAGREQPRLGAETPRDAGEAAVMQHAILALVSLLAGDEPRVGDVYAPGDEATFVFEAAGARMGEHWWSYVGEADLPGAKAHHFEGGLRIEQTLPLGKLEIRARGDLWTDDHGHPLRFVMRMDAGGTKRGVDWSFADGKATGKIVNGPSRKEAEVAVAPEAFLLANNWVGMLELAGALAPPSAGSPRSLTLFSADAGQTLPFELRHQGTFTAKRPTTGDAAEGDEALVEGEKYRDSLGEVLKFANDGKLFELEIPAQGVKIRRTREPFAKFEIELAPPPRDDFERSEVTIDPPAGGESVRLAGTITRKKGTSGRLPAVFFVSGSGGQDREGVSGGIDLGTHELLDRLTEEGFLVLRVDDRGVGSSKGPTAGMTFDDLVADARACVDFLLARDDVDGKHLFVIGHSEGGETAPILACERPLAGIVLMAAPGRSLFDILREQKQQGLQDAGLPPALIETELEEHRKALDLLTQDGELDPAQLRADYRSEYANRAWYRSHRKHDPIAQIKRVKCPVLIAQGGKDLQVSAERDAPALERALAEAGNRDVTLKLFPDLDHLFKKVAGEKPSYQEYFTPRPVDAAFLAAVAAWLHAHAR